MPKPDGRQRPIGIAALEDKIVQQAVVQILNQIYETDFLGFSYGLRPGRNPHQALDATWVEITQRKVNWVMGFQYRSEAERLLREVQARMAKFGLELHPEKTRLIEFGRFTTVNRAKRGEGKPETFDFGVYAYLRYHPQEQAFYHTAENHR